MTKKIQIPVWILQSSFLEYEKNQNMPCPKVRVKINDKKDSNTGMDSSKQFLGIREESEHALSQGKAKNQ
jgi:hypothetical protein